MPVKKSVRFAALPKQRRPQMPLPGFPYSSSSKSSSAGHITPQQLPFSLPYDPRYPRMYQNPYQSNPLPNIRPPTNYQVSLHPYLLNGAELMQWNLLDHHTMATRGRHQHRLLEPASHPPLPYLKVVIRMNVSPHHPHPYWTCRVHASNRHYVSVWDVLESLFNSLRRNIAQSEFDILSEEDRASTSRCYKKRYRRLDYNAHASEQEKVQGMKRIDFLMGRTRFAGLSAGHHPEEFLLNVGRIVSQPHYQPPPPPPRAGSAYSGMTPARQMFTQTTRGSH